MAAMPPNCSTAQGKTSPLSSGQAADTTPTGSHTSRARVAGAWPTRSATASDSAPAKATAMPRRSHTRPLASGALPIPVAIVLAPAMTAIGLAGTLAVDPDVFLCLVGYLALTLAYSFGHKTQPVVDVLTLGALFTLRLLAGHLLVDG